MLFSPRNVLLTTTILVTILSFTKNTDAGIPVFDELMSIWGFVDKINAIGKDPQKEIMNKFTKVFESFHEIKEQISGVSDSIESLKKLVTIGADLKPALEKIFDYIDRIEIWSDKAQNMIKVFKEYETKSLLEFAEDVVLRGETATFCMNKILKSVTQNPLGESNVIQLLIEYKGVDICEKKVTTPQLLYIFYTKLLITEAKALATMQFSFMVLRKLEQKNYTQEMKEAKEGVDRRVKELTLTFASYIGIADKTIYKCDPKKHVEGLTYDRLTRLVQGYISNENFLSRGNTCLGECDQYKGPLESVRCENYYAEGKYCASHCANGVTFDCYMAGEVVNVCHNPDDNLKRYLSANSYYYDYGKEPDTCQHGKLKYWGPFKGICHACFCLCDEEGPNSDRFFNLDEVKSDIQNNKVVTGIRLKKNNRVFHFELQQGKLLSFGAIDPRTLEWIDKPSYHQSYDQQNIYKMSYKNRSIYLDERYTNDPNYVVTGIQFLPILDGLGYQVHLTRFNFSNGKLDTSGSNWIHRTYYGREPYPVVLSEPAESHLNSESKAAWLPDQYVQFTHTDWKKDVAQTTIPYIDIQPVVNTPAAPLSGVRLYHKGKEGFGGFVGVQLLGYVYDKYLEKSLWS